MALIGHISRLLHHNSISLIVSSVLVIGCATATPPHQSGFLDSYDNMVADPSDTSLLWWELNDFNWSDYDRVMIDPITIILLADSEGKGIQPEKLTELTDAFRSAVVEQMGGDYPFVSEPGSGVLRIQAAITDVKPANAALNVITTLVAFVPVDMGGASIEVKLVDSNTDRLLATGMDRKLGVPTQVTAGFTSLGHAKRAFEAWAKELHAALETNP